MTRVVHKLIAKTAKAIAAEAWEVMSSNDRFHAAYPHVSTFVRGKWPEFVGYARASLATMLKFKTGTENNPNGPEYYYSQHIRDEIEEALIIDGSSKAVPPPLLDVSAHDLVRHGRLN